MCRPPPSEFMKAWPHGIEAIKFLWGDHGLAEQHGNTVDVFLQHVVADTNQHRLFALGMYQNEFVTRA